MSLPVTGPRAGRWPLGLLVTCVALVWLFVAGAPAWAGVTLEAPAAVADGQAFVATVTADQPAHSATFAWRGKRVTVPMTAQGNFWLGMALLPVALDTKAGTEKLKVDVTGMISGTVTGASGSRPAAQVGVAEHMVAVRPKAYPRQELTVEGKYVNPVQESLERHNRERERVKAVLSHVDPVPRWTLPLLRPVPGEVSSQFGLRRVFNGEPRAPHRGLDLRAAEGDPILAVAPGKVVLADNHYFAGNSAYVDHGSGVVSLYLHMSRIAVAAGSVVARGDIIGYVGSTGRVTAPHLHFGLAVLGENVDPLPLFEGGM